ncbi:hypothetical protein BGZ76_008798 [Entomortierella beljakovae]|nr:hypothetical protein BGZ76_008798 [Entomortierella beljakovae]
MLGHTSYVTSLKCRGDWIVSGGYDEKVRLWEASTGKCMKIWEVDSAVSCVELYVDSNIEGGGVVVAAFVDIGLVKIWSLHGPLNMHTLSGHQKGVRAIAINEIYLVTAGFDQTVLVWNWMTGQKVASFRAHNEVILGVHLSTNILYTFCIDATLRVFEISTRTLLYQAKLFDVQQGASLQWSYLKGRMFLTATTRKVYVWQLEQLESLHQQHHLRLSFRSSFASAASSENNCSNSSVDGQSNYLEIDSQSRSRSRSPSRSRSISPFNYLTPPETPSSTSFSSSCSSYFYSISSVASSSSSLQVDALNRTGAFPSMDETKIKPCLTAILNMTMDMWCGKVTHHDPPLLILGSRSSPVKLVALELTRDIIDPSKVYTHDDIPQLVSPKVFPVQGMPAGHGRGVMCIDSDTNKLVVGCTGGSIHAFYMDPAKRTLGSSRRISVVPQVVIVPHEPPTPQMDSSYSAIPIQVSSPVVTPTYDDDDDDAPIIKPSSLASSAPSSTSSTIPSAVLTKTPSVPSASTSANTSNTSVSTPANTPVNVVANTSANAPTSTSTNTITIPATPRRASVTKITPPKKMVISTGNIPITTRCGSFALPTPDQSPRRSSIPIALPTPNSRGIRSSSPPRRRINTARHPPTPPSDFEEQEVLVDFEEDLISNVIRSNLLLQGASDLGFCTDSRSKNLSESNNSNQGRRDSLSLSSKTLAQRVTGAGKTATPSCGSSSTSHTLSSLSKFMPGPTSRMMLRRRSTFMGTSDKAAELTVATPAPASTTSKFDKTTSKSSTSNAPVPSTSGSSIMKWRSRSDPNLLSGTQGSPVPASTPTSVPTSDSSATKRLSKSWSLSSAWNSPSRRASKSKAV